jgi:hypothetical protein
MSSQQSKLEISAEQIMPGSKGGGQEREGTKGKGENDPNNVCTIE